VWESQDIALKSNRLLAFNADTGERRVVADTGSLSLLPSIDGDLISWEGNASGNYDIWVNRLSTGETFQVTTDPFDQRLNRVFGNLVAYIDKRTGNYDVFVSKLAFVNPDDDTTPPALTVPTDIHVVATSTSGALVTYTASATDAVDGPVTPVCSPPSGATFSPGTTVVTCTATDQHGNSATKSFSVSVTYDWSGLLAPISDTGTSVFRVGRTVPVKFALAGASAPITDGAFYVFVARWSDQVLGTDVAADSTSAATEGNTFRYDATAGQYVFQLSTKSLSVGTWTIHVDLGDGVVRGQTVSIR
jgi:hypothetical protein